MIRIFDFHDNVKARVLNWPNDLENNFLQKNVSGDKFEAVASRKKSCTPAWQALLQFYKILPIFQALGKAAMHFELHLAPFSLI